MGARLRVLALALAILMMVSSCLAANRKVTKVDVLKHEDATIVHGRTLLDDGGNAKGSSVTNHHYIPREDFNNYPGSGGDGNG
ncbi:uncharacterized protein LOC111303857 [Durio zibethinus]|uniref:Uncharacterized protein LOC111303857 n=1 Tax=Durio zibethinus TaxID=66656 RepID=A0A6P5ZUD8_DURZI|nr:uncharacterized protein LOC111303857 [Durio zibethinus]